MSSLQGPPAACHSQCLHLLQRNGVGLRPPGTQNMKRQQELQILLAVEGEKPRSQNRTRRTLEEFFFSFKRTNFCVQRFFVRREPASSCQGDGRRWLAKSWGGGSRPLSASSLEACSQAPGRVAAGHSGSQVSTTHSLGDLNLITCGDNFPQL